MDRRFTTLSPGSPVANGVADVRLEQANAVDWSARAGSDWRDAESLYEHLCMNTSVIEAARRVPWDDLIPEAALVLDLGCGSGWLAGMLSGHPRTERVIAWDASATLLADVLPETVGLVGGDLAKV